MRGRLSYRRIYYIYSHLLQHFEADRRLFERIVFDRQQFYDSAYPKVYMPLSDKEMDINNILWIDGIPVLFPFGNNTNYYEVVGNSVYFHHDLLKSAFYLLSGYQEWYSSERDDYGRFPYKASIQYKLNIIHKPIVNYYFDIIREGLRKYCHLNGISFQDKSLSKSFVFLLTHDVDLINAYDLNETLYKVKQFLGISRNPYSRITSMKVMLKHWIGLLFFPLKRNPYWSFPMLHRIALKHNLTSVYFFLEKDLRHKDSYYRFTDKRILRLMKRLSRKGYEVALHGTTRSAESFNALLKTYENLSNVFPKPINGIRQHTLRFFPGKTPLLWEQAGLKYDSTLGYPEHEGFRNSYCYPFKIYDFKNERALDIWEYPLNVMDVTLFGYRKLSQDDASKNLFNVLHEVIKFGGIFTLLWHNSFFDEHHFPGITEFYKETIAKIASYDPDTLTGTELLHRINSNRNSEILQDFDT